MPIIPKTETKKPMYFNDVTQTIQTLSSGKGDGVGVRTFVVVVVLACDMEMPFGIMNMSFAMVVVEDVCLHMVVTKDVVTLALVAARFVLLNVILPDVLLHAFMLQIKFSVKLVHSCKLNSK